MSKHNCDILIPLFFFQGRDVEIIIPLKFYLEKYCHYKVQICSVFDPLAVDLYQPKLVLMENTIGSTFHVEFADYAYSKGFRVVSLISEGLVIEAQQVEQGTWGHNTSKKIVFDKILAWNEMQKKLISRYYPVLKDKIEVTGALAFDRYKIYSFATRRTFLKKYAKEKYQRVIGYAGFVFSGFDSATPSFIGPINTKIKHQFLSDEKVVRKMLLNTITKYPDVLFVFKQHPGEPSNSREIVEQWAKDFDNVLYFHSQEPIADIINVCDLWMVYDSTTSLEAWLLNKPTITLMPSNNFEMRNDFYKGSLIAKSFKELDSYLTTFITSKPFFLKLAASKKRMANVILSNMMKRTDGMNAAYTAQVIDGLFKTLPYKPRRELMLKNIYFAFRHLLLFSFRKVSWLPILNRSVLLKWLNEYDQFVVLEKRYLPYLRSFSKSNRNTLAQEFNFTFNHL